VRFFDTLKIKVFLPIFIVTGLAIFLGMGWLYYVEKSQLLDMVNKETALVTEVVTASIRDDMIGHRNKEIETNLVHIQRKAALKGITVVNGDGSVVFSSKKESLGKVFSRTDRTCTACHSMEVPPEKARIITKDTRGKQVFRSIRSIVNDKECRSCHGKNKKVLGILFVDQYMGTAMLALKGVRQTLFLIGLVSLFLVSCCVFLIIETGVLRPVYALMEGVRRLASGNLDAEVHTHFKGEMRDLLGGFNEMVRSMRKSVEEIKEKNFALSTLVSMKEKITKGGDMEEARKIVLTMLRDGITQIKYSLLMWRDHEGGDVRLSLLHEGQEETVEKRFPLEDLNQYREFINPEHVHLWASGSLAVPLNTDGGSGMILPLTADETVAGLLYVKKKDRNQFGPRESRLLSLIASDIAIALVKVRKVSPGMEEDSPKGHRALEKGREKGKERG